MQTPRIIPITIVRNVATIVWVNVTIVAPQSPVAKIKIIRKIDKKATRFPPIISAISEIIAIVKNQGDPTSTNSIEFNM